MDPVPLDPDLVARFKDKTMAIVGYESDQGQNHAVFFSFQALRLSILCQADIIITRESACKLYKKIANVHYLLTKFLCFVFVATRKEKRSPAVELSILFWNCDNNKNQND